VLVTMWEATAVAGRGVELAAWALRVAPDGARVYGSADDRVVVIGPAPLALPPCPGDLVDRPPHAWDFTELTAGHTAP
jgi:hypothetical protein